MLWTATEMKTGAFFGAIWGFLDLALGGIDAPIIALATLIILDFITGISGAYMYHELCSRIGAMGLIRKAGIFVCIMLAYLLDTAMAVSMFRGMVITGFAIIEAMSIIENIDKLGFGYIIPCFLRVHLAKIAAEKNLTERSDSDDNT